MFTHSPDGILVLDQELNIVRMNPVAGQTMQIGEEAAALNFCSVCSNYPGLHKLCSYQNCFITELGTQVMTLQLTTPSGLKKSMNASLSQYQDPIYGPLNILRMQEVEGQRQEEQNQIVRMITHSILSAQENERKRISRELHDGIGQSLYSILIQTEIIKASQEAEEDAAEDEPMTAQQESIRHTIPRLIDPYGREHNYLRISVTDRCNLRCVYCMPEEGMEFEPAENILTFDEIAQVVRVSAGMGVRKIRLTGGEPLVRKNLEQLVAIIAAVPEIEDISMTTNGMFLAPKAQMLKDAGLTRVNISLDSLKPDRFKQITRGGDLKKVLAGIDACAAAGLSPIKLNVMLMKGQNEDEIVDFIRLTRERELHVRFIEYMPIGHNDAGWKSLYQPLSRVMEVCSEHGWEISPADAALGAGPSENFRIDGAREASD